VVELKKPGLFYFRDILKIIALSAFWIYPQLGISQSVWQPLEDDQLYHFMDELANDGHITLPTVAKPYARELVYEKFIEALDSRSLLPRQKKQIGILLRDFGFDGQLDSLQNPFLSTFPEKRPYQIIPPRVFARNEWSKILIRPIYGIRGFHTGEEAFFASYGGAEMMAYLGKGFAVYGSIRDNFHQKYTLSDSGFLTQEMGAVYKRNVMGRVGGDFSESRGGITYNWEWGTVGFVKDHLQWGNHYGGANIFSGRTPSFPMITLDLQPFKWLKFKYYHGWLVSEVVDSLRSYQPQPGNPYRAVFRRKQIAANLFTISPWPTLDFSFGNSIIYSDIPVQPAYLIPFMFFKSVDHTLTRGIDNQNSQMFADLSYRGIRHLHLFSTLFIDELSFTRIFDPNRRNFYSFKIGAGLSNWPVSNIGLELDYTLTSPLTYIHRLPTLTFESNRFNLGHYMVDNASTLHLGIWWKPYAKLSFRLEYNHLQKGEQHRYFRGDPIPLDEKPFLENIIWESHNLISTITYAPFSNFSLFGSLQIRSVTPAEGIDATNFRPLFESTAPTYGVIGFQYGFQ
jgi:hypothetical protein